MELTDLDRDYLLIFGTHPDLPEGLSALDDTLGECPTPRPPS